MDAAEPRWIVNDMGELGVEIGGRCFFLYKGHSLEYPDGCHDDGTPILYRPVGKREFGETCKPEVYYSHGYAASGHYTETLRFDPFLSDGRAEDYAWRPLPRTDTPEG